MTHKIHLYFRHSLDVSGTKYSVTVGKYIRPELTASADVKMNFLVRVAGVLWSLLCVVTLVLSQCEKDAFQLVQGDSSVMIVEICHDGQWKRICRDEYSEILASVVCKEKLFSSGGKTVLAGVLTCLLHVLSANAWSRLYWAADCS